MVVTPSGPVEADRGVRVRVRAAGKALERDDRQTNDLYIIVRFHCIFVITVLKQSAKRAKVPARICLL